MERYTRMEILVANILDTNFETNVDANNMRMALLNTFSSCGEDDPRFQFHVKELKEGGFVVAPELDEKYYRKNEDEKFEIIKRMFANENE